MVKLRNLFVAAFLIMLTLGSLHYLEGTPAMSPGFRIVSTGNDYTEIEFELSGYELIPVEIDGEVYQRLYHPQSGFLMDEGKPELISFSALISVPDRGAVTAEEPEIRESKTISSVYLFPSQGFDIDINDKAGFLKDTEFYKKDIEYPGTLYRISNPAIMRDYRLVTVNIFPIIYNPAREELTLVKRLTLRINYDENIPGSNEITRAPGRPSRSFESLFRRTVLNHDQFRNPNSRNEYQKRSMIVVHHQTADGTYVNSLNQFLNWKRDKGFEITTITPANYSTTHAIRNYILNAYENWENRPEYVVMIGNKSGGVSVPIWSIIHPETYNSPTRAVDTDHLYTTLDGDDDLSDIFIGRINVANGTQLATFWNKIRNYEREPFMVTPAWYERQLLVSDPRVSGISTIFTNKYIKSIMQRHNPDYNIIEVTQTPFPTQMQNAINQGVSFFNFRGLEDIGGWWYPTDNDLNNGFRMPNMVVLTCRTMLWSSNLQIDMLFNMGTPTTAKGSITGIGMSHVTRTAFNNSLAGGIFCGIFVDEMNTMGEALVRGKLNLWQSFYNSHWAAEGLRHIRMINLFGDPSMDIWKGIPQELNVDYHDVLPPGSNSISIIVTDENELPVKDAWVTIRRGTVIGQEPVFRTGYTDSEGRIIHFFSPETRGEVKVTVTKPDYIPHLGSFDITGNAAVVFDNVTFNGNVVAGSQANFIIRAKNYRTEAANGVSGTISTESEYIEIAEDNSDLGNITANGTANSNDDYIINISPETPSGYRARFNLTLTDNAQNSWLSRFEVMIHNGFLVKTNLVIDDDDDGVLDPTEQAVINIYLRNDGQTGLEEIYGALTGGGYGLNIVSDTAYFGNIEIEETLTSSERHFSVSTSSFVMPGMNFNLLLHLFNDAGFYQQIPVTIPIGTVTVNDPLGPDEYGYWCFDSGDTDYVEAPEYDWIEIVPALGGQGTNTGVQADWNNNQGVHAMDLPFTFRFYGEAYNVVSISANGWITFGQTEFSTQRNWILPGPLGPCPIIAAFWDNLSLANGGVYTWYDQENDLFVIQWQNARNILGNAEETFQIILYDPEYYFTTTNDGPIKIQYRVFNNVNNGANTPGGLGNWGNYATIGIADHTGKRGLQYTFNNTYPTAARVLGNRTALYFATGSLGAAPYIAIDSFRFLDGDNDIPEFGDTGNISMTLANIGGQDASDITAVLSSEDEYVTILQDTADYGDIASEHSRNIPDAFTIRIADNVPSNHRIIFYLSITAEGPINWNFRFHIDVKAPELINLTPLIYDPVPGGNDNGIVDPGEELIVYLPIKNIGGAHSPQVFLDVSCDSEHVTITSVSETDFETILVNNIMYPAVSVSIGQNVPVGTGLVFDYEFETGEYLFRGNFLLGVGGIIPAQLGTGNAVSAASSPSPINVYFRTLRGQSVYTAEELSNAGVTSGGPISSLGFYVVSSPNYSLPGFSIRMRHTEAIDASEHIDGPYTTVYTNNNYAPVPGDWDMLPLNPPFEWNGVDNILIDTAFAPVESWHSSGQVRIYDVENGYRYTRADAPDQTNVPTNAVTNEKPQVRLMIDTGAGDTSNRPANLTALLDGTGINLSWTAPDHIDELLGFNVYRNGLAINDEPVEETVYRDEDFDDITTLYYYVTAVYETRETLPSNIASVSFNYVANPHISPEEGNYYEPIRITITCDTEDAEIYYTLNGEEPTVDDNLYTDGFYIYTHTKVRVKAFKQGMQPSEETKAQYWLLLKPTGLSGTGSFSAATLIWQAPPFPESYRFHDIDSPESSVSTRVQRNLPTAKAQRAEGREQRAKNRQIYSVRTGHSACPDNSPAVCCTEQRAARRSVVRTPPTFVKGYNVYRATETGEFSRINAETVEDTTYIDSGLDEGLYRYYVTAVYEQGESKGTDPVNVSIVQTVVEEEDIVIPYITELGSAYPNPFNPETVINFSLSERARVAINIYDITGRKVITLVDDEYERGKHSLLWRGIDEQGRRASSGIYFYKMETSQYRAVRKIVLLK